MLYNSFLNSISLATNFGFLIIRIHWSNTVLNIVQLSSTGIPEGDDPMYFDSFEEFYYLKHIANLNRQIIKNIWSL